MPKEYKYDVAYSFAGEDRTFVREVAEELMALDVHLFYNEYEEVDL